MRPLETRPDFGDEWTRTLRALAHFSLGRKFGTQPAHTHVGSPMKLPPLFTRASWEPRRHTLVDEAALRARSLRVLCPDASMQSLAPEARGLIDDCANELWSLAFGPAVMRADRFDAMVALREGLSVPDGAVMDGEERFALDDPALDREREARREREPRAVILRSMREACDRWKSTRDSAPRRTPLSMAKARLDRALLSHDGLRFALHAALRAPTTSDAQRDGGRMSGGAVPYALSAFDCIVSDLLWRVAFESPSPFAVQLRLWERGVWPVWSADGTLIAFVPVMGREGLAMSEESSESVRCPRWIDLMLSESCVLEEQPPCALDALIALSRDGVPMLYELDQDAEVIEIGRHRECDLSFQRDTISRRHCSLRWDGAAWILRDTGSTSGTYVDGALVRGDRALSGGEVFVAGRVWFWFIGSRA